MTHPEKTGPRVAAVVLAALLSLGFSLAAAPAALADKSNNGNHYGQIKNGNNGNHYGQIKNGGGSDCGRGCGG